MHLTSSLVLLASLLGSAAAHGDHGAQKKIELDEHANWMMIHMAGAFCDGPNPQPLTEYRR